MSTPSKAPKPWPDTLTFWVGVPTATDSRIEGLTVDVLGPVNAGFPGGAEASAGGVPATAMPHAIATADVVTTRRANENVPRGVGQPPGGRQRRMQSVRVMDASLRPTHSPNH